MAKINLFKVGVPADPKLGDRLSCPVCGEDRTLQKRQRAIDEIYGRAAGDPGLPCPNVPDTAREFTRRYDQTPPGPDEDTQAHLGFYFETCSKCGMLTIRTLAKWRPSKPASSRG